MKRLVSLLTLLVMMLGLIAACGQQPVAEEPTPTPTAEAVVEPTETTVTVTEKPAPTPTPTEKPAATEKPEGTEEPEAASPPAGEFEGLIKIATQSPLSGPQAAIGVGIRNGAELGVEQLSEPLTSLGFTVELAPFDDQAQAEVGTANANNIVSDPDILCVNGHLNSGVALAALPTYSNASVPMVSPANTNPNITEGGYKVAFRIVGRDDVQGAVAEQFAREQLNIKSVFIIHDQTDYGQGVAEFFRQNAEKNGITVLGFEGTQEQSQFDSILTPILPLNPDLIFFGGIYSQAGPLFDQARRAGITAQFMGPDGLDNAELVTLAGEAVADMYYTSVAAPVSQFPAAAQFAEDYQSRFNTPAPPFSAQSYDVVGICVQAIARAAIEAGGKPTREQVLEALRNLDAYEGITGTYEFNEIGDPTEATYFVLQVNYDPDNPEEGWNKNAVVERLTIAPPEPE